MTSRRALTDEHIRRICDESTLAAIAAVSEWLETLSDDQLTLMAGVFQRVFLERFGGGRKQ